MSEAQRGAMAEVKRFNIAPQSGGIRSAAGTFLNPSGYADLELTPTQAVLKDGRQLNSRKSKHKSFLGEKAIDFSCSAKLHENTCVQYGTIFEGALGKKWANTTLAINSGGTNSVTVGTISSGVPDPIVKIEYTTGLPDYVPVKTYDATTITWGIQTRKAARTVSAYYNATDRDGECYSQDPAAPTIYFYIEADQGAEPNDLSWTASGFVPTVLELTLPLQDRAGIAITMTGTDFDDSGSASTPDIIEQTDFDEEFLGYVWDVNIQSLGTPAAPTQQPLVAITGCNFAPTWVKNMYSAGRAASAAIPGSAAQGWKQGVHFDAPLVITLDVQNTAWLAALQARTKYQIFLTGYSGQPDDAPSTSVMCVLFREATLEVIASVDTNGIMGHQLTFTIHESLDSTHRSQCDVAFFNA